MSVGATTAERQKWKAGSYLQVYIESDAEWRDGKIVQIVGNGKFEKLVIAYEGSHGKMKTKLPRNSKHLNVDIFNSEYNSDDAMNSDAFDGDDSSTSSSSDDDSSSSSSSSSSPSDTDSDSVLIRRKSRNH